MKVYLSLGSNQGNRKDFIQKTLKALSQKVKLQKISGLYETPAQLLPSSPPHWNQPFLNLVVQVESLLSLKELFEWTRSIEMNLGRKSHHSKWSPRTIDIDFLGAITDEKIEELSLPHPQMVHRDFVLSPFRDVDSLYQPFLKDKDNRSILNLLRSLKTKTPAWMDIFNLTPDSFSDGKKDISEKEIQERIKINQNHFIQWIDVGGFSTRPGASLVSLEEEWKRLEKFFSVFKKNSFDFTKISVDTFRSEIAGRALKKGASAINDVSGLQDPKMLNVLKESDCDYILMHSLGVPVDPQKVVQKTLEDVKNWLEDKLCELEKNKISLNRVIFDPGIGFGKTSYQSLEILQNIEDFLKYPVRLLVGHSRKSFMSVFSSYEASNRTEESIGISMNLAQKGVDILRVHQAFKHSRSWLAFKHVY